jgi:nucleoid DNA-binding protein
MFLMNLLRVGGVLRASNREFDEPPWPLRAELLPHRRVRIDGRIAAPLCVQTRRDALLPSAKSEHPVNTKELIERVVTNNAGLKKPQVRRVIDSLFTEIRDAAKAGDTVQIRGFGQFKMRAPAAGAEGDPRLTFRASKAQPAESGETTAAAEAPAAESGAV